MLIRYFAFYRYDAGCKEEKLLLEPRSAMDLLKELAERHGQRLGDQLLTPEGNIHPDVIFLLNGRNIDFLDGVDTLVQEDDVVSLFPRVAGG